jgi:hypothetical protein
MGHEKKSWLDMTVGELWQAFGEYLDPPEKPEDPNAGLNVTARRLAKKYQDNWPPEA